MEKDFIKKPETEENSKQKKYEALKNFFTSDMKIKEEMIKIAPTEMDYGENEIEYIDKMYKFLRETERYLMKTIQELEFGGYTTQTIKDFFAQNQERFLEKAYQKGNIQELYKNQISNMDEKLIEEVKEKFVGYSIYRDSSFNELISKAKTINEFLHVIHSYIMNNEQTFQSMPVIEQKINEKSKYPIVLYGEKTELAQKLFDEIPKDLDCGYTDIISMKDRILMMIRDRGHALTIDIENSDIQKDLLIKYFIPKLCNEEMIRKLPGIGKVTHNGANGMFTSKKDELSKKLFDFIEKVPTDEDIPLIRFDDVQEETNYKYSDNSEKSFEIEEAREIAYGTRIGRLVKIQKKLKDGITNLRSKFKSNQQKEEGINDDRTERD